MCATDEEIRELADAGVRAVRFNLKRGGSAGTESFQELAQRVYDLAGWHTELYVDSREVSELSTVLKSLPAVSIDHLGMHDGGLEELLERVEAGVNVKATGFGRVELDPAVVMRKILETDPSALMVGTDVPSTRAARLFEPDDLALIKDDRNGHPGG